MKHDLTQANATIVQSVFEAFGRGDIGAVLAACAPDIEWGVVGNPADFPCFGARKGLPGVESFFRDVAATHRISVFEPTSIHAVGDHVYASVRYEMTVPQTGRAVASEFLGHFEIENGKIRRMREYVDTAALSQAWKH